MDALSVADSLVKEYLLFRGFTSTIRAFETDKKQDKSKSFQSERIVEHILLCVTTSDLLGLRDTWSFLQKRFFSRLQGRFIDTANKLTTALYRYYLVAAVQNSKTEKVVEFFKVMSEELLLKPDEWISWFCLPYTAHPESNPTFQPYFNKQWIDTFSTSLSNFVLTVFQNLPLPQLLSFNIARLERKSLESEVERLKAELDRVRVQLDTLKMQHHRDMFGEATEIKTRNPEIPVPAVQSVVQTAGTPSPHSITDNERSNSRSTDRLSGSDEPFVIVSQEVLTGHTGSINRCRFSEDGGTVASASADATVRIWPLDAAPTHRNATVFCTSEVLSLEWAVKSPKLLLLGTADRQVKLWNVDTKRVVSEMNTDADMPRIIDIASSPTDPTFVTAVAAVASSSSTSVTPGRLLVWDLKTSRVEKILPLQPSALQINTVRYNHNGNMLVSGGVDGMIRIFDTVSCTPIMGWPAHQGDVLSVRFSSDETTVFSLGTDGKVLEWSLHKIRKVLQTFSFNGVYSSNGSAPQPVSVADMVFDHEGKHLLVSSPYNSGVIFQMNQPDPIQRLGGHNGPVTSVDWHPTMHLCLTGSADHSIRVRKVVSRTTLRTSPSSSSRPSLGFNSYHYPLRKGSADNK
eukprot:GILK01007177.1.p1 GENE.GILK01007177.1~~GILK01007177.1.p1  ORF type:complete len:630 (-),score=108.43 GILK01007177.1:19-1908(-)